MVPAHSHKVSRVSWYSGSCLLLCLPCTGFQPLAGPKPFYLCSLSILKFKLPECTHSMATFPCLLAATYMESKVCCFLFLRLLRCFSSLGSFQLMDWLWILEVFFSSRFPSVRYLRINGYLLLPGSLSSLSRLHRFLSAKASTIRSY